MTVTLSQLVDTRSQGALQRLNSQPVPARTAYHLIKVAQVVASEVGAFNDTRLALCRQYGTLPEGASNYEIAVDKRPDFDLELKELLATEVELPCEPLSLEALGAATVSAADLAALSWLVVMN